MRFIFQDWKANQGNPKGRLFLVLFRLANICAGRKFLILAGSLYILFYKVIVQTVFCIDFPWNLKVGKNLAIYHCMGLVVNRGVAIGDNCILRHCTTIGVKTLRDGRVSMAPIIGNNVDIGCNSCIIGGIRIGDNVKVGSGSVVVKDVRSDCSVAGNPAIERSQNIS